MKQRTHVQWWEPGWSFRLKLRDEFKPFRNPWLWVRMELAVIAFLGCVFWLIAKHPEIELPLERFIAMALVGPFVVLGTPLLALWLMPPLIDVNRKGICIVQGQGARWWLADEVRSVHLLLQVPEHPLLRVSTDAATGTYGIGDKVSVADLEAFIREVLPSARCERVTT